MIAVWIGTSVIVAALLGLAASILERAMRPFAVGTRWIWLTAIVASACLSASALVITRQVPSRPSLVRVDCSSCKPGAAWYAAVGEHGPKPSIELYNDGGDGSLVSNAQQLLTQTTGTWVELLKRVLDPLDALLLGVAIGSAVLAVLALVFSWRVLGRRVRAWPTATIGGIAVRIAPHFGPAVAGAVHPEIVLPEWTLHLDDDDWALLLAHEGEHARSHDVRMAALALLVAALAPWNAAIWWMIKRLRFAIEVDCDRRVLRQGYAVRDYGTALLHVAERIAEHRTLTPFESLTSSAFLERASILRRRIEVMANPWHARSLWRRCARGVRLAMGAAAMIIVASTVALGASAVPPASDWSPLTPTNVTERFRFGLQRAGMPMADRVWLDRAGVVHLRFASQPSIDLGGAVYAASRAVPYNSPIHLVEVNWGGADRKPFVFDLHPKR